MIAQEGGSPRNRGNFNLQGTSNIQLPTASPVGFESWELGLPWELEVGRWELTTRRTAAALARELVSQAVCGDHVLRMLGIRFDLLAQPS